MVNPFKSKKGVAIEMSIIFLLTVFFLCVIIKTTESKIEIIVSVAPVLGL